MKQRASHVARTGGSLNQASEMLDLYLGGDCVVDIAAAYNRCEAAVYSQMAKEALFRVMVQHQAQRLEDVSEVVDGAT
jgi:hypothetical protein